MKSITTQQLRAIESARWRQLRTFNQGIIQDEIRIAKQVQQQTGCTWTEALRIAYQSKAGGEV